MSSTSRTLLSITIVLLVSLAVAPSTEAQCSAGIRAFSSIGGGTTEDKLRIDPNGAENLGNETGRFWQSSDSSFGNNFDGGCPSQGETQAGGGWWQISQTTLRGVDGLISGTGCFANTCPEGDLTVLVEEQSPTGYDAYFIAFRIDETPPALRRWDLSRTHPGPFPAVVTLEPYPEPVVLGVNNLPGNEIALEMEFPDIAPNVHSASWVVKSYDLYQFNGDEEPGRDPASWTLIGQWPYQDSSILVQQVIMLPVENYDVYLALGLTFQGGSGPDVAGTYVGSSVLIDQNWLYPPNPAGAVPDGEHVPGTPLMLGKQVDEQGVSLTLTWGPGCLSTDYLYAIYEGLLGDYYSHIPLYCQTASGLNKTFQPPDPEKDAYYLVAPQSYQYGPPPQDIYPSREGSHGRRSNGNHRPVGGSTCLPVWYSACP